MDSSASSRSSSCCHGSTETALQQLLPWLDQEVKAVVAADGGRDDLAGSAAAAAAKTGKKKRRSAAAQAGVARGMKVLLSGVVEMVGKRLECSVPAAKFGHVAYIR